MGRKKAAEYKPQGTLSAEEMCELWHCCKSFLSKAASQGMPRVKVGDAYFYNLSECQKWYRGER